MDESLMGIVRISTARIKELAMKAKIGCENLNESSTEMLLEAEIILSKLENGLAKLQRDLNNYFRLSNEPAADEVSEISTYQLDAEETLCELKIKLKRSQTVEKREEKTVAGRLSKLDLPEFDGNLLEWHQFWDRFSSNIDNRNLADVDKLLYLKAALKGEARRSVDGLETTNKNYEIAIASLKERYGKIEQVIDAHYSALNKIEPASLDTVDCRRVMNDIERHLRILESLGENTGHGYLRFLIMEKFPQELIYETKMKAKSNSIADIRRELQNIISAREEANRVTRGSESKQEGYTASSLHVMDRRENARKRNRTDVRKFPRPHMKGRLETVAVIPTKRRKLECVFCKDNHFNDQCKKFKSVQERKTQVQLSNRCFSCLGKGHVIKKCLKKIKCVHCGKSSHNRALCTQQYSKKESTKTFHMNGSGLTVLQTATVVAKGEDSSKRVKCRVLLDSGSQRTYITQKIAKELNLRVEEEDVLTIFTFGSTAPQQIESPVVIFQIESRTGKTLSLNANVVPMITQSVPHPDINIDHWKNKIILADDGSMDCVDILVGNDYYFSVMSTQKVPVKDNLYLVNSDLGWILSGSTGMKPVNELEAITYFQTNLEVKLYQPDLPLVDDGNLKKLWELESIGIYDSLKESREEEAIRQFNETVEYVNARYYVSWPWIEYPPPLTHNFGLAFGRLVNLVKRLEVTTLTLYDQMLKEQKEKGIIEIVPDPKSISSVHPIHYIPHHGVKQPNKPIRIVYDASSKLKDGKSLNECLYCGPTMLEDLTGLLLKFRCHPFGICADVEKAFLQVGLHEKDRDVTRFLWLKDTNKPVNEDNLLYLRFCRVPFGIISSPFLLNATIKYHLKNSDRDQIRQLSKDIYVDNLVTGVQSEREAMDLYKESKEVFQTHQRMMK